MNRGVQETARQFLVDYFAFIGVRDKINFPWRDCDRALFQNWNCCERHRNLARTYTELTVRADVLNDCLKLGAIPMAFSNAYRQAVEKGVDPPVYDGDSLADFVMTSSWIVRLAEASGVSLAEIEIK
ncbi:hypothetical protein M1116_03430 [Patescibacteria group bacterium]|nr:hypothetical protein [Patescibacteria group bacterium]